VFEFKADQAERAEAFLKAALDLTDEAAEVWLSLSIEARRFKLSAARKQQFDDPFRSQLDKKVRSEVAAALVNALGPFVARNIEYPGRDWHVEEVVGYLKRTTRIKYRQGDLEVVCGLLEALPNQSALLEKLTARGMKLFPKSPIFLLVNATLEFNKGPYAANLKKVRKQLESALDLLTSHPDTRFEGMAEDIRRRLLELDDIGESMPSFRRFARTGGESDLPPELAGMMARMFAKMQDDALDVGYDEDEDEDSQDAGFLDNPFAAAFAKARGKQRKARKKK
jgi:hypothetical protein